MSRASSNWLVAVSLLVGLMALVIPLPTLVVPLRPYLLALVLAYWLLESPHRIGLGTAFMLGLMADVVSASLLGEQALRLVVLAFLIQRFRARLRFFPLWQQAGAMFVLLLNDCVISALVHVVAGDPAMPWLGWLSPALGFAVWPWLFLLLDELRLRTRDRGG